jgi:hypothetical protein
VKRLAVHLSPDLLDLDREVEVVWNGRSLPPRELERSFFPALEAALERGDWRSLYEAKVALR